jgi:hypothetical protein
VTEGYLDVRERELSFARGHEELARRGTQYAENALVEDLPGPNLLT